MSIGTKSLLFGYHQVFIHPLAVAWGWFKLFGFPWDPRLWVAFVVHDWGYWGKADMDGKHGQSHPRLGAGIMGALFGPEWYEFALLHSRYYAKQLGKRPSRLCAADKAAIAYSPALLQAWLMLLTGEYLEYMANTGEDGRTSGQGLTLLQWVRAMQGTVRKWLLGYIFYPQQCPPPDDDRIFTHVGDEPAVALHPGDVLASAAHVQQIGPLVAERDNLLHSLQRMNLELNQTKLALLDARRELAAALSRELALRNMPFYAKK